MYSRRSSVVFTYIICVLSTKAGTDPSSLPGLRVPPLPAGPWQTKQPSVAASRTPRRAGAAAPAAAEPPARADGPPPCNPACGSAESRAIFLGKGETLYVEVQGGLRALVRPGEILTPEGGKAVGAKPGMAFGDPDVLLEDLAPFTVESLKLPQISDEGVAEVVVTAAPGHPSSYVLIVHTIDPEQRIIVKTQYYRDWVGNLVKMRRTADVVEVGGHRRPGTITIENFRRGTTTHLSFAWREAPYAPAGRISPAGLRPPAR